MRSPDNKGKFSSVKYLLYGLVIAAAVVGYVSTHAYASKPTVKRNTCTSGCVLINLNGFSESELAVKVGSYIEFRSADGRTHDLALGEGTQHISEDSQAHVSESVGGHSHGHVAGTDSGVFGADEAWKVQFKKAGTYVIHDHLHPEYNILVIAYESP